MSVGVQSTSIDQTIAATVTLTDGDGDPTGVGAFNIHIATGLAPDAPVAPVVLDLNGDGVHFLSAAAGVTYDYGHGLVATAWASPQDGILVHDANHNGTVDGASEFVFGSGGVTDLQALNAYDSNHDGKLSAADAEFGSFAVWQDANSNGKVDAGEFISLTAAGITSISLTSNGISYSAAGGDVTVAGTGSFTKADGSTGVLADATFQTGLASVQQQQLISQAANNNSVLVGAIAAAGLGASTAAAAHTFDPGGHHVTSQSGPIIASGILHQSLPAASVDVIHNALAGETRQAVEVNSQSGSSAHHSAEFGQHSLTGGHGDAAQAPTALLHATEASVHSAPAHSTFTSGGVGMPSLAMLAAAHANQHALEGQAKSTGEVSRVVADALAGGGHGPNIDAVIDAVANQAHNGHAALAALASHGDAAVSAWHMASFGGFPGGHTANMMEHMALHAAAAPHAG